MQPKASFIALIILATSVAGTISAQAEDAKSILKKMSAVYSNAKAFSVIAELLDTKASAKSVTCVIKYTDKKSYLALSFKSDTENKELVSIDDGNYAYSFTSSTSYSKKPSSPDNTSDVKTYVFAYTAPEGKPFKRPSILLNDIPAFVIKVVRSDGYGLVYIQKSNYQLLKSEFHTKNSWGPSVNVLYQQIDVPIPDSEFEFHPPKGAVEQKLPEPTKPD